MCQVRRFEALSYQEVLQLGVVAVLCGVRLRIPLLQCCLAPGPSTAFPLCGLLPARAHTLKIPCYRARQSRCCAT